MESLLWENHHLRLRRGLIEAECAAKEPAALLGGVKFLEDLFDFGFEVFATFTI